MRAPQQDNASYSEKVMIRQTALGLLTAEPVILETHGGIGDIYSALYTHVEDGVVFEKEPEKAEALARQRPTWAVYEADCEVALAAGAGSHLVFNYLDVDPYGAAWPALRAYFNSQRTFAPRLVVVVNDGLRHKARSGSAWDAEELRPIVEKWGNHAAWDRYWPDGVRLLLDQVIEPADYHISYFDGYTTGIGQKLVHLVAVLEQ